MAVPPNKINPTASRPAPASDAELDQLPIQKTSPLVYVAIAAVVCAVGGAIAYSKLANKPDESAAAAAVQSAEAVRRQAVEAKAKELERLEHLQLTAKAFAAAEEKEKEKAAAAAPASPAPREPEPKTAGAPAGGRQAGGGEPPRPPKGRAPSARELDELDKLGSSTNSELGGK
ncbi:MAG: hypothetical protein MUF54_15065 [Polyangiaceae bacterium]|nr:hypothetical protein [Polyangiaceae bacterium]